MISILKEFGPYIQHIAGIDNIIADTLSRLPSANNDKSFPSTPSQESCHVKELFAINATTMNGDFPLNLSLVQEEQNKE